MRVQVFSCPGQAGSLPSVAIKRSNHTTVPMADTFASRAVTFAGHLETGAGHIKRYHIAAEPAKVDWARYTDAIRALCAEPCTRPVGVGFVICHPASYLDYLVRILWGNANELFVTTFVRELEAAAWQPAGDAYSWCVWDAEVIAHERAAFIETMMQPTPSPEAYLALGLSKSTGGPRL